VFCVGRTQVDPEAHDEVGVVLALCDDDEPFTVNDVVGSVTEPVVNCVDVTSVSQPRADPVASRGVRMAAPDTYWAKPVSVAVQLKTAGASTDSEPALSVAVPDTVQEPAPVVGEQAAAPTGEAISTPNAGSATAATIFDAIPARLAHLPTQRSCRCLGCRFTLLPPLGPAPLHQVGISHTERVGTAGLDLEEGYMSVEAQVCFNQ
jgi:hypothetical protein